MFFQICTTFPMAVFYSNWITCTWIQYFANCDGQEHSNLRMKCSLCYRMLVTRANFCLLICLTPCRQQVVNIRYKRAARVWVCLFYVYFNSLRMFGKEKAHGQKWTDLKIWQMFLHVGKSITGAYIRGSEGLGLNKNIAQCINIDNNE